MRVGRRERPRSRQGYGSPGCCAVDGVVPALDELGDSATSGSPDGLGAIAKELTERGEERPRQRVAPELTAATDRQSHPEPFGQLSVGGTWTSLQRRAPDLGCPSNRIKPTAATTTPESGLHTPIKRPNTIQALTLGGRSAICPVPLRCGPEEHGPVPARRPPTAPPTHHAHLSAIREAFHLRVSSWFCGTAITLRSCPALCGQRRSLLRRRQLLIRALTRSPGPHCGDQPVYQRFRHVIRRASTSRSPCDQQLTARG